MKEQEILKGNKLIANFMDLYPVEWNQNKGYYHLKSHAGNTFYPEKDKDGCYEICKYHLSWNSLMPVVEKIGKCYRKGFPININITTSGAVIMINPSNCAGKKYDGEREIANTLNINYFAETEVQKERYSWIEGVWLAVIYFIKWYTKINKTNI